MTGIALLGAGIFATTEHLPAIEAAKGLELLAVYSRSQASAEKLAAKAKSGSKPPNVYYDCPPTPGHSLDDLLARTDISAVITCLPILTQPAVIRQVLAAGKHVLSEKPIAQDVAAAKALIKDYSALPVTTRPLWGVAENYRYFESLRYAAEQVRQLVAQGGRLVAFNLVMNGYVDETNEYFQTEWRKSPGYQGGFLLDGGVHFVAGLRCLLGAAGDQVQQVACFGSLHEPRLPPVDTLQAVATTRAGINGIVSISFATEFKAALEIEIITTTGRVHWTNECVKTVRKEDGHKIEVSRNFAESSGVAAEVAAFARGIAAGVLDFEQTPEPALQDLTLLETLLTSGADGKITQVGD